MAPGVDVLAGAAITVASTSFVIVFGVITLFPLLLDFFESRSGTDDEISLLRRMSYRFSKRLLKGNSLWALLISAILFLLVDIVELVALLILGPYPNFAETLAITGVGITILSLVLVIGTIIYTVWKAHGLTDNELDTIQEYTEDTLPEPPNFR